MTIMKNVRVQQIGAVVVLMLGLMFGASDSGAQILSRGDMFGPGAPPAMIGVELGMGMHSQQGTYQALCHCEFTGGSETGFLAGLMFELPLSYEVTVGLGAKFDFGGLDNTALVEDVATIRFENPVDSVTSSAIHFQRNGTVRMTTLIFNPFIRYEFYRNGPFVQVGPGIGLVLSSSFVHTRELLSSTVTLTDGSVLHGVVFENSRSNTEELENDSPIPNINNLQLSAQLTVGYNIPVGDNSVIAPMITYGLPLSKVRDNILATDWKISTIYATLGLKMKLD